MKSSDEEKEDRQVQDNGEGQGEDKLQRQDSMEAEEGDFVNMEIAFAYRPSTGRGIKSRAKHAHLYLAFYLPGKVKLRECRLNFLIYAATNTPQLFGSNSQA